jgi:hypothetical protein
MSGFIMSINPGLLLILAGVISAVMPIQRVRQVLAIGTPLIAMFLLSGAAQTWSR